MYRPNQFAIDLLKQKHNNTNPIKAAKHGTNLELEKKRLERTSVVKDTHRLSRWIPDSRDGGSMERLTGFSNHVSTPHLKSSYVEDFRHSSRLEQD